MANRAYLYREGQPRELVLESAKWSVPVLWLACFDDHDLTSVTHGSRSYPALRTSVASAAAKLRERRAAVLAELGERFGDLYDAWIEYVAAHFAPALVLDAWEILELGDVDDAERVLREMVASPRPRFALDGEAEAEANAILAGSGADWPPSFALRHAFAPLVRDAVRAAFEDHGDLRAIRVLLTDDHPAPVGGGEAAARELAVELEEGLITPWEARIATLRIDHDVTAVVAELGPEAVAGARAEAARFVGELAGEPANADTRARAEKRVVQSLRSEPSSSRAFAVIGAIVPLVRGDDAKLAADLVTRLEAAWGPVARWATSKSAHAEILACVPGRSREAVEVDTSCPPSTGVVVAAGLARDGHLAEARTAIRHVVEQLARPDLWPRLPARLLPAAVYAVAAVDPANGAALRAIAAEELARLPTSWV